MDIILIKIGNNIQNGNIIFSNKAIKNFFLKGQRIIIEYYNTVNSTKIYHNATLFNSIHSIPNDENENNKRD